MRFTDTLVAFRRRWVIAIVGLLATAGLGYAAWQIVPPTYEVKSYLLLLPPKSTVTDKGNPYLQLGGLQQAVDLLGVALSDQASQQEVAELISKTAEFEVAADGRTSSPVLVVTARDDTKESALRVRDWVVAKAPGRLQSLQTSVGVGKNNLVTMTILTADRDPEEVGKTQLRALLVAVAGGLALSAATVAIVDAWLLRRAARRATGAAAEATAPTDQDAHPGQPDPQVGPPSTEAGEDDPLGLTGDDPAVSGELGHPEPSDEREAEASAEGEPEEEAQDRSEPLPQAQGVG